MPAAGMALSLALAALTCVACTSTGAEAPISPATGSTPTVSTSGATASGTGLILPDESSATATPGSSASAGRAAWPQAPRLAWLDGSHGGGDLPADGVRITDDGTTRWQSATPGEFALLRPDGYEWFGPDGSMVGCTADAACVGFAADGTIAIRLGRGQPAAVYDAGGRYIGNFQADGASTAPTPSPPALAEALGRSGVDVSSLVDAGTGRMPFAGGVTGDPHLITAGGVRFSTQLTGQYVARGGDPERAIQLELDPMAHRRDVSLVSGVAIGAGRDVVRIAMSGQVTIDAADHAPGATFDQVTLDSGLTVGIWPRDGDRQARVAVVWPDGGTVMASANPVLGLTVVANLPSVAATVGLFGAGSATGSSDLVGRSGLSQDTAGVVTSWQVTRPELLFDALVPPLTGFPSSPATIPSGAVPDADAACRAAGIEQVDDRTACVFDTGLTGDDGFIVGHQLLAIPAEARLPHLNPSSAWALWPALLLGAAAPTSLPSGGLVDLTVSPGQQLAYRLTVPSGGRVSLVYQRGCGVNDTAGIGAAAGRLFDAWGHPVSHRTPLCGHQSLSGAAPGLYTLVLAGATDAATRVRVQVSVGG